GDSPRGPGERGADPDRDPRHRTRDDRRGTGAGVPTLLSLLERHRRVRPGSSDRRGSRTRAWWHDRARVRAGCGNASLRRGAEREDHRLMPERILIVEDEPAIAEAVEYALRAEGFEVEAVGASNAAVEQVRALAC